MFYFEEKRCGCPEDSSCLSPGSLCTHSLGSSPLKSPGAQPPRLSPILQPQKQPSETALELVGRGHNLCPPYLSSDSRSSPAVSHLPGGQGVLLPLLCPVGPLPLPLSAQDAWIPRGAGALSREVENWEARCWAVWNVLLPSRPTRAAQGGEAGRGVEGLVPCPLVGVCCHGNIPFFTQREAPLSLPGGWSRQPHRWLSASGTWQPSLWQPRAQQQGPVRKGGVQDWGRVVCERGQRS